MERDFGLRPIRSTRSRSEGRAPTRAEDRMARDRGLVSEKEQIKALIRDAAKNGSTMSEFVRRLRVRECRFGRTWLTPAMSAASATDSIASR
jgi:hypothetical protein